VTRADADKGDDEQASIKRKAAIRSTTTMIMIAQESQPRSSDKMGLLSMWDWKKVGGGDPF